MEQKCHQCVVRDLNSLKKANPEDLVDIDGHKKSLYFKKGESIFTEGKSLKGVYCLRNGNCKLTKLAPNGKEQIVRFVQKGELVGYRSVLSNSVAHLTVTAMEDMEVCFIPKNDMLSLIHKNAEFSMEIT